MLNISEKAGTFLSVNRPSRNFSPCPKCGRKGKRVGVITRTIRHAGALNRPTWIRAEIGVYKARCSCCKYFRARLAEVPGGARYSYEVRNLIANALVRDRMTYRAVCERLKEEFHLEVSLGYVHQCFTWAHEQIDSEERLRWAVEHFSGVLCIDEVHDGPRTILFTTDPLSDFTVSFEIVETNDADHMDAFLERLKARGIEPEVVITDGSPLYKSALESHWAGVEHQLCIFHTIRDVNKAILNGVRAVKNRIGGQGRKGRKRRRGRPRKGAIKKPKESMSKKEQAAFLWEHQHLVVKKHDEMTKEEKETLKAMFRIAPELKVFRRFNRQFYRLFERGITKEQARRRRSRMVCTPEYQENEHLAKALRMLEKEKFEKMIVFMGRERMERTNNHVERNNRVFRMLQKTRYKRRTTRTIRMALELDLYARMLEHELYKPPEKENAVVSKDDLKEKEAA